MIACLRTRVRSQSLRFILSLRHEPESWSKITTTYVLSLNLQIQGVLTWERLCLKK